MARKVFLSYARSDLEHARRLYRDLMDPALEIWFDQEDLLPGVRWRPAIRKAIRESRYFIALLSKESVSAKGFRHSELRQALEVMEEFSDEDIFVIPTRLDACKMPLAELDELSFADLFPDWSTGVGRLRKALGLRKTAKASKRERTEDYKLARKKRKESKRGRPHYRIGIADADSGIGQEIRRVARALNKVQSFFRFRSVELHPSRKALTRVEDTPHLDIDRLSSRFYDRVAPLEVDHVVVVTRRLLSFEEDGEFFYGYLAAGSPVDERVLFTSMAGLAEYADQAGVTLDVALAYGLTSQLVSYFMDLEYHDAIRGCPLDFTEDHADMVKGLKKGRFCTQCQRRLKANPALRRAVLAMLEWGRD